MNNEKLHIAIKNLKVIKEKQLNSICEINYFVTRIANKFNLTKKEVKDLMDV